MLHFSRKTATILLLGIAVLSAPWLRAARAATFHDALGREVVLPQEPRRIISLLPSLTEILYDLGLADRVVGVTTYSNYPPAAASKPKVGSYININVERILSLAPDLVIGSKDGNERMVVRLLEQAGIPVFVVNPRGVYEAVDTVAVVAKICGIGAHGAAIAGELRARAHKVTARTRRLQPVLVLLQINVRPIMAVNRHTVHHDLIRLSGGINMTAEEPVTYPRISIEEVILRKPEVILISSMERGGRFERARQEWLTWSSIPAARNGRVHLIDSDLIDRPSPRLVEGLERMAAFLHPEL